MVNTYAVQSGGCRFESLWGFGYFLKGAHYEVDYSGKKTYLAGLRHVQKGWHFEIFLTFVQLQNTKK